MMARKKLELKLVNAKNLPLLDTSVSRNVDAYADCLFCATFYTDNSDNMNLNCPVCKHFALARKLSWDTLMLKNQAEINENETADGSTGVK